MPWQRRPFAGDLSRALNIADLRSIAQRRMPHFAFEYLEGGAEDEASLQWNRGALSQLRLLPRTLIDTSGRHLRSTLLGAPVAAPLVIAPTGMNGLFHADGDLGLARPAARLGIPFTLSTVSTTRLEEVAHAAPGRLWMQLYVMTDRRIAEGIMRRAAAAGYEALVFTTDANVFGRREWDLRSYRSPGRPSLRSRLDVLRHPRWLAGLLRSGGLPRFRNLEDYLPREDTSAIGGSTRLPTIFEATIRWDDLAWIRDHWPGKLLVKGVLSPEDAEQALALGCNGIVITNHGGRQLDTCVAALEMLPEIAATVGKRLAILVDGGFRRGTDIVKALALGADAVMLGRATLYGLGAGGERGVAHALQLLTVELDRALGMLGCCSVAELTPRHVRGLRAPAGGSGGPDAP